MSDIKRCDFLIIGAGLAGLSAALRLAEHGSVMVLSKDEPDLSNTAWAQGGIAAVWDPVDSVEGHVQDTLEAGAHLADPELLRDVLADGPQAVEDLIRWGVSFSKAADSEDFDLTREGGHQARRVLHAGDMTGAEIQRAMLAAVRAHPAIQLLAHHVAIDLVTRRKVARHAAKRRLGIIGPRLDVSIRYGPGGPEGWQPGQGDRCLGAYALDVENGRVMVFAARATVLATGGAGKVYRYTSNPDVATGDGLAMAYRAGAVIGNMEFVQFHPTCLFHPEAKSFLISEALRGEGGVLRLPDGRSFMDGVHPMASLAPRDIVAREIDARIKRHGLRNVLLDMTHLGADYLHRRFPGIHEVLKGLGIDMSVDPIPVVPAAHYFCGGVAVDREGRTRIEGLFAVGEVSCSGLHGANRLASNSLLEAAVFGGRAARSAVAAMTSFQADVEIPPWDSGEARDADELVVIEHTWDEIRRLMWNYVGIVRTDRRLNRALARIGLIKKEIQAYYWDFKVTRDLVELRNIALVAELVVRSALARRESRGLHYNLDCSARDDVNWRRMTTLRREW
ncbi:MAG: L-aspartate oxidase [Rickettsiales bacterium]|nr:L-aspartate oxidase [Rickettsiales bacterium]